MRCVNHPGVDVQSFCQSCGKALCSDCVRTTASGQIFCEACLAAAGGDPSRAYWQAAAAGYPVPPPPGSPNPAAAAVLGLIPGVGAMYNGQLFKGLIHVVVFAVLVSITHQFGIFGIFIGAWVLYQSFEAFHTAKARRDGLQLPDPFGLNELGSWLNLGGMGRGSGVPPTGSVGGAQVPPAGGGWAAGPIPGANPIPGSEQGPAQGTGPVYGQSATTEPPPYSAPFTSTWSGSDYQPPQAPYSEPYPGSYPPGAIPPIPPIPPTPPYFWRRREPIWAVIMIALGLIFLLQSLGVVEHLFRFAWPLLLIGFGVWMIIRRVGYIKGGSK